MKKENLDKLRAISGAPTGEWLAKAEWRVANREWLDESKKIALKILSALRSKGITKTELAERMGVKAQYITTITKGEENLSLSTIKKLEKALEIKLLQIEAAPANYIMQFSSGLGTSTISIKGKKCEEDLGKLIQPHTVEFTIPANNMVQFETSEN